MRQNEANGRCKLPARLRGRPSESAMRDYVFALMLVSAVAQLEEDIESLSHVPGLSRSNKLAVRLRILRDHFNIPRDAFDPVDRIRTARNAFVHDGELQGDAGCTKAEIPGIMTSFLRRCNHPDYL